MKFGCNRPVVSDEKSFEIVDGRRTDGRRTTEPAYTISFHGAFGSGEMKIHKPFLMIRLLQVFQS